MATGVPNAFDLRRYGNIFSGTGGQPPQDLLSNVLKRRAPLFSPPPGPPAVTSTLGGGGQEEDPYMTALSRVQNPTAGKMYREHLKTLPDPAATKPSKMRRLGAALTGAAAAYGRNPRASEMGADMRDAKYKDAITQWQMKGAGLKEQSNIESNDIDSQMKYIEAIRKHTSDQQDMAIKQGTLDVAQQNANTTAAYRQGQIQNYKNQGWKQMVDEQGMVLMINPITNETKNFGPSERTTEMGMAQTRTENDTTRANAASKNADTFAATAGGRLSGMGYVDPGDQFTAGAMATQNVVRQNPQWANWVRPDGTIKAPSEFWRHDPTADPNYKLFLQAIKDEEQKILLQRRPMGQQGPGPNMPFNFDDLPDR